MYVCIYLSCVCFNCIYCFSYSYSITRCLCLFRSTVHYQHQQCQHVCYQHLCHHDVLLPSKCNWNTTAAGIRTRSDNGNGNGNCNTRTTQQRNADWQQSFSITNNVDTSYIKSIANTPFPPSAIRTPQQQQQQQQQQQLQPERDLTMAMKIVTRRQHDSSKTRNGNEMADQQATSLHQHGHKGE